jgi:RNA recognition motif-containing protein
MAPKVAAKPAAKPAAKAAAPAKPAAKAAAPAAKAAAAPVKAAAPAIGNGLYVKGLKNESVADVKALFAGATEVRLRRNKFALVYFETPAAAKKTLDAFNNKEHNGVVLSINAAKAAPKAAATTGSATVFVSPIFRVAATRKQVREQFAGVGKISKLRLYRNNYAFVTFANAADAAKAVKDVNGKVFQNKTLVVKAAVQKA